MESRKMNQDPIFLRILDKLYEAGRTDKELLEYLKLANGSMTQWKYRGVKSYMKYISPIADFLGTTKNYLLNGNITNFEDLITEERNFMIKFRELGTHEQSFIIEIIDKFHALYKNYAVQLGRLDCSIHDGQPAQS